MQGPLPLGPTPAVHAAQAPTWAGAATTGWWWCGSSPRWRCTPCGRATWSCWRVGGWKGVRRSTPHPRVPSNHQSGARKPEGAVLLSPDFRIRMWLPLLLPCYVGQRQPDATLGPVAGCPRLPPKLGQPATSCQEGGAQWPSPCSCMTAAPLPAADVDIAYTAKPLWESYLAFIEEAGADGAFQYESPGGCTHLPPGSLGPSPATSVAASL